MKYIVNNASAYNKTDHDEFKCDAVHIATPLLLALFNLQYKYGQSRKDPYPTGKITKNIQTRKKTQIIIHF